MVTTNNQAQIKGASPDQIAWRGIELCRAGDWRDGLYWLGLAAGAEVRGTSLPSLFYAYLGFGVARYQGKKHQGLKLCRHALELEFYQPENYLYLARTYLLLGDRRNANDVIERGLQIDATNESLVRLRSELGQRLPPVFPFLARGNPLNRAVGRLRHGFRRSDKSTRAESPSRGA